MMKIFPIAYPSQGHSIRGLSYNPASGIPSPVRIILIHGYSSSKHAMDPLASALCHAGYAVVSIDLPGHKLGATGGTLTSFGQAVQSAMDANSGVPYSYPSVYVGHSLGAATALVAAARDGTAVGCASLGLGYPVTVMRPDPAVIAYYLARWDWIDGASPIEIGLEMDKAIPNHLPQLQGRPFLLINGQHDVELPPPSAQSLFEHARDPKEIKTVDTDHGGIPRMAAPVLLEWLQCHWPLHDFT